MDWEDTVAVLHRYQRVDAHRIEHRLTERRAPAIDAESPRKYQAETPARA